VAKVVRKAPPSRVAPALSKRGGASNPQLTNAPTPAAGSEWEEFWAGLSKM